MSLSCCYSIFSASIIFVLMPLIDLAFCCKFIMKQNGKSEIQKTVQRLRADALKLELAEIEPQIRLCEDLLRKAKIQIVIEKIIEVPLLKGLANSRMYR